MQNTELIFGIKSETSESTGTGSYPASRAPASRTVWKGYKLNNTTKIMLVALVAAAFMVSCVLYLFSWEKKKS